MSSPRLSIDFYEHFIDACAEHFPRKDEVVERYQVLTACALVCSDWLPRSRLHLYRSVALHTASAGGLFERTLRISPALGSLVRELMIGRLFITLEYISFAHGPFFHHLRNATFLYLQVNWRSYPPSYQHRIAQLPIRTLCLNCSPMPMADVLHLVWALRALEDCTLHDFYSGEELQTVYERLGNDANGSTRQPLGHAPQARAGHSPP